MMNEAEFYPWHSALRERVRGMRESGKVPHALLLSGPRFQGKRAFALATANYLLCKSPIDGEACGTCDNCLLFHAGTHPDFRFIEPEESKLIRVEQIRDLIDWAIQTSQRGGFKVVIVQPAEQMNVNSANALLKCLEEPPKDTLIMLVSDLPGRLLPTIRSRCQPLPFTMPTASEARSWLETRDTGTLDSELLLSIAGGAPLRAVRELDSDYLARRSEVTEALSKLVGGANPLDVAGKFARSDAEADLAVIHGIVMDAIKAKFQSGDDHIKNRDLKPLLKSICDVMSADELFEFLDLVAADRLAVAGPSNPNIQLLFEALFVRLHNLCASGKPL